MMSFLKKLLILIQIILMYNLILNIFIERIHKIN